VFRFAGDFFRKPPKSRWKAAGSFSTYFRSNRLATGLLVEPEKMFFFVVAAVHSGKQFC
jgi:hypothetical protein